MERLELRAWDKKNKVMFDVFQWNRGDEFDSITRMIGFNKIETLFVGEDIDLLQYTGLKDKNDEKVYEGDIITFRYGQSYIKTEVTSISIYGLHLGTFGFYGQIRQRNTIKIIGNVYESPELLEEKKGK